MAEFDHYDSAHKEWPIPAGLRSIGSGVDPARWGMTMKSSDSNPIAAGTAALHETRLQGSRATGKLQHRRRHGIFGAPGRLEGDFQVTIRR